MLGFVRTALCLGALIGSVRIARADDATAKTTAEALFVDGRRLMSIGDYATACTKLAASQRLDPGVGTALNLADCYEKSGRFASAWGEFRSAARAARAVGSSDREALATERARSVEPKLSFLTLSTTASQSVTMQLYRDGELIDRAVLGTPIPIDPGHHVLEARAPGKKTWTTAFDITLEPMQTSLAVPDLVDEDASAAVKNGAVPAGDARQAGAQRAIGVGVALVGVLGAGAGTLFGLKAQSRWDEAKAHCGSYPAGCDARGVNLGDDAKEASNISTVAFVVGAAGLIGGAVIYFTAPRSPAREPARSVSLHISPFGVDAVAPF